MSATQKKVNNFWGFFILSIFFDNLIRYDNDNCYENFLLNNFFLNNWL